MRPGLVVLSALVVAFQVGCSTGKSVRWGGVYVGNGDGMMWIADEGGPDFKVRFPDGAMVGRNEISRRRLEAQLMDGAEVRSPDWGDIEMKMYQFWKDGRMVGRTTTWDRTKQDNAMNLYYPSGGSMLLRFEGSRLTYIELQGERCNYDVVKPAIMNPKTGRVVEFPARGEELEALWILFGEPSPERKRP